MYLLTSSSEAQARVYEAQAAAYNEQKEMAKIESSQMEAERRDLLRRQLASLGTSMSAQGVALAPAQVYWLWLMMRRRWQNRYRQDQADGYGNRRKYELGAAGARASARYKACWLL